eukprot:TRINITY_DN4527_c0_g1_i1.p1 TRINITY_DN4527_c0_g1~~TRINITY_DN4527_c0_g1_i1.p1  ORF type:complete len:274 (+),score=16.51 TRINITY_DN4527_c0_g1_i1:1000-1821(+)
MKMNKATGLLLLQILVCVTMVAAAKKKPAPPTPTPSPSPAPAPAPAYVNLTALLSVAGPFSQFLQLLQSTGVLKTVQDQANISDVGLTLFVPTDKAFSSVPSKTLAKLGSDQKKALLLAHAIPRFYTLSDFQNFSNPARTMASGLEGGKYNLNITSKNGAVSVSSGYVKTSISSTVYVTDPAGIYSVGKVLLPQDIFGVPAPTPAPAPSRVAPKTPSPSRESASESPSSSSSPATATSPAGSPSGSPSAGSFLGHVPSLLNFAAFVGGIMLLM